MPKVSVVTGYFNRGPLLERTIQSILQQSFEDIELIVFDDASNDDTASRLMELETRFSDPRLKCVVHETNVGFVQGLIDAIAQSSGEYIAIQGSGDVSAPERISRQVELLDNELDVGVVGCWFETVNEASGTISIRRLDTAGTTFDSLLAGNVFSHGEVMFRRNLYDAVGGYRPQFRFTQDYDLWLRLSQVSRFATAQAVLYRRFLLSDGVAMTPSKLLDQRRFQILARRLRFLSEGEERALLEKVDSSGIARVIPNTDPEFRRSHFRATVDMGVNRSAPVAVGMAAEGIDRAWLRTPTVAFFKYYDRKPGAPARFAVRLARAMRRARHSVSRVGGANGNDKN